MSKVIDINIHHIPEDFFENEKIRNGFLSTAPRGYHWKAEIVDLPANDEGVVYKQMNLEHPEGYPVLNYVEGDYNAEAKLRAMDAAGVDYGIMRVPVWQEWLRVETCAAVNDNAAKIVSESNGRLFSTACVPPWDFRENYYELDRAIDQGAVGVQLACHYGQLYLDNEAFRPFLKKVAEKGLPVVVHHTPMPPFPESIIDFTNLRREFGRITDQGTAVGRELFSDLFEEIPNLRFIHTMLGGNWFAAQEIMTPKIPKNKEKMNRLSLIGGDTIKKRLNENIFYDLTHPHSWGKDQIEAAIKISGADHYFFGSSFPVFLSWMSQGVDFIKNEVEITDEQRNQIFYENAKKMFNLPV
jgi:predicted TIM-barrel fold metal-dependent hydrolase